MKALCVTCTLALLFAAPSATVAHGVDNGAQYLGNEGVLVVHADTKVLFDAFFAQSYGQYALVEAETSKALINGQPPYDGIDAVFVSHMHGDHFSSEPTLAYLRAQPEVRLFAPEQVAEVLRGKISAGDPLLERIVSFDLAPGDSPARYRMGKILVEPVNIPHSGGKRMAGIANLVFRVSLGKWPTVLHMGDADSDEAWFAPLQSHWDARTTDIAFPPYWFYLEESGQAILKNRIKARQSIGIHVPAEAADSGQQWRDRAGADLFTDPGEWRRIKPPR